MRHLSVRSLLRRTSLWRFADDADWSLFGAVVSLHAHTHHSREVLADLPPYITRIPVVGRCFEQELDRRRALDEAVDFSKGWWHPPVTPRAVFESETTQIDRRFGLDSIVSVTDHDDVAAGVELQRLFAAGRAPVSLEWTVPYREGFFHLGVHNLPGQAASQWFTRLSSFTAGASDERLIDLLRALHVAEVLIVLNHPLWDLGGAGEQLHAVRLREFLDAHESTLHAVEINGYRSREENGGVRRLSAERGLPLISGGDRHAFAPNALLNLTRAKSFGEFAAEVRDGVSHIVVMPEYQEHLTTRILASVADVLGSYRVSSSRWQRWTDRVSCDACGAIRPLSDHWPNGGPLWVRSSVAVFRMLASPFPLRVWRAGLEWLDGPPPVSPIPTLG